MKQAINYSYQFPGECDIKQSRKLVLAQTKRVYKHLMNSLTQVETQVALKKLTLHLHCFIFCALQFFIEL